MKKFTFLILIMITFCSCAFGCTNTSSIDTTKPVEVTEAKLIKDFVSYDFAYSIIAPGKTANIKELWNNAVDFYGVDAFDTFLIDYLPEGDDYYFIYLKKDLINSYIKYLKEYVQTKEGQKYRGNFYELDNPYIMDGKYLFAHKILEGSYEDVKVYKCNNLEKVSIIDDGYQMVFCGKTKSAIIKANISRKEEINRDITIYRREIIVYSEKEKGFEVIEEYRKDTLHFYEGERLVLCRKGIENLDCLYGPKYNDCKEWGSFGDYTLPKANVTVVDGKKYVPLPRYYPTYVEEFQTNVLVDLLDMNFNFLYKKRSNPYVDNKEEFIDACVSIDSNVAGTIYYLFDFDKVCEIIYEGDT